MLIAFSGLKESGKDTAAKVLIDEYGFTKIAFADALREALLVLDPWVGYTEPRLNTQVVGRLSTIVESQGWDWAKHNVPEVRRLMQVFGTEVGRQLLGENIWVDILAKKFPDIADPSSRYVISDCRFPNERDFVQRKGGSVVWIDRPGIVSDGHASENTGMQRYADYIITNDSTLSEFQEDVRFLMHVKGVRSVDSTRKNTAATN